MLPERRAITREELLRYKHHIDFRGWQPLQLGNSAYARLQLLQAHVQHGVNFHKTQTHDCLQIGFGHIT